MQRAVPALRRASCGCCLLKARSVASTSRIARPNRSNLIQRTVRCYATAAEPETPVYTSNVSDSIDTNQPADRQLLVKRALEEYREYPERFGWAGLKPGDWVESRGNRQQSHLIFLKPSDTRTDRGIFLASNGVPVVAKHRSITFVLPAMIDAEAAVTIGAPIVDDVPDIVTQQSNQASQLHQELGQLVIASDAWSAQDLEVRRASLQRMRQITLTLEGLEGLVGSTDFPRSLASQVIERDVVDRGAPFVPVLVETAVNELLKKWQCEARYQEELERLTSDFPGSELVLVEYAAQQALLDDPLYFVPDSDNIRYTRRFLRRPRWQERALTAIIRAGLYEHTAKGMRKRLMTDNKSTVDGFCVFLEGYLANYGRYQADIYSAHVARMLKSIVAPQTAHGDLHLQVLDYLQMKGHIKKGENLVLRDPRAPIASWDHPVPYKVDKSITLHERDPLEGLRKRIDVPIYIIDSVEAFELDDGVAVDKLADGSFWVQVVIADPAALLPKDHEIAEQARWRMQTIYFGNEALYMLPASFKSPTDHASAVNLGDVSPQRCMLFSVRFDEKLNAVEADVRAGEGAQMIRTTYQHVDALLKGAELPQFTSLKRSLQLLPAHAKADFELLGRVAEKLFADRVEAGMTIAQPPRINIPRQPPDEASPTVHFPDEAELPRPSTINGQLIVQEMMILANRIAARFCAERNLPVLYRTIEPPVSGTKVAALLDRLKRLRDPKTGEVPWRDALAADVMQHPAICSLEPGPHLGIGIENAAKEGGYLQVTSPMRRYTDLLAHWQIHSALRGEAPAFSRDQVQRICNDMNAAMPERRDINKRLTDFRKLSAIAEHVPSVQPAIVLRDAAWNRAEGCITMSALLPQLDGVTARVKALDKDPDLVSSVERYKAGNEIKVRLEQIVLDMQPTLHATVT